MEFKKIKKEPEFVDEYDLQDLYDRYDKKIVTLHECDDKEEFFVFINHENFERFHVGSDDQFPDAWDIWDLFFGKPNSEWKKLSSKSKVEYKSLPYIIYIKPKKKSCDGIEFMWPQEKTPSTKVMLDFCRYCWKRPETIWTERDKKTGKTEEFNACKYHDKLLERDNPKKEKD